MVYSHCSRACFKAAADNSTWARADFRLACGFFQLGLADSIFLDEALVTLMIRFSLVQPAMASAHWRLLCRVRLSDGYRQSAGQQHPWVRSHSHRRAIHDLAGQSGLIPWSGAPPQPHRQSDVRLPACEADITVSITDAGAAATALTISNNVARKTVSKVFTVKTPAGEDRNTSHLEDGNRIAAIIGHHEKMAMFRPDSPTAYNHSPLFATMRFHESCKPLAQLLNYSNLLR